MRSITLCLILALLAAAPGALGNNAPEVRDVSVKLLSNGIFEVAYRLVDADNDRCTITVHVSTDDGNTWSITPSPSSLSGDLYDVLPGYRKITWDSKIDMPGDYKSQCRIRLTADDGVTGGPTGMVWVAINDPGVTGHEGFNGYMSKYETTNAQYCQFLNAAKASGDITVSGSYVKGANGSNPGVDFAGQNYYYLSGPGNSHDGVTNGGAARINWTGSSFTVDSGFENHPVTYVSWYGASAFADYYGWRLPTEWEWQAVADYDGSYKYGCGTTINNSIANYLGSIHPHGTTAVGAFGTYGYGMADMAGNVWEWTSSLYSSGSSDLVVRGGCWRHNAFYCRVADRDYHRPHGMDYRIGIRVCR